MADVKIEIQAIVDKAIADINKVTTAVGKADATAGKAGGGLKAFGSKLDGALKATTGLSLATVGWAAVAGAAVKVVSKAVDGFIEYSNQMQDLSRLTGESVEDMSRLVQVGDDVRLTYGQMKTAMQIASRQGIDVSINGIKSLSEEYLKLQPGLERSQFLLKTFGRAGADMGRLLEMGADGIDKATAAVADGLVMDEKAIAKAEKLRLAKDNLADATTALGNKLASGLVPALAWVVEGLVDVIGAGEKFIQWITNNINKTDIANKSAARISGTYEDYRANIDKSAKSMGYLVDESGNLVQSFTYQGQTAYKLVDANYAYTKAAWDTKKAQEGMNDMAAEGIGYFGDIGGVLKRLAEQELEAATQAAQDLSDTLSSQMGLTLKLTDLTGDYTEKIADLTAEHKTLEDKLAKLKLDFPWDKEGIAEAEQALKDNQAEIDNTALAYDQATKRIVWDMMVAKLAIDGYTQAEFDWAMQAGVDMGIITQESADLAVALMADADKEIKAFEDTQTALSGVKSWIDRLESKDIYIRTYYESQGTPPPAGSWQDFSDWPVPTPYANGGSFVIPPGYPNDSYPLGPMARGQSGERVTVTPAGKSGGGGDTYNLYMETKDADSRSVLFGFRTMQMLNEV